MRRLSIQIPEGFLEITPDPDDGEVHRVNLWGKTGEIFPVTDVSPGLPPENYVFVRGDGEHPLALGPGTLVEGFGTTSVDPLFTLQLGRRL